MNKEFFIWEGIYENFIIAEEYSKGDGFESETWHKKSLEVALECLKCIKSNKPIPQFYKQRSSVLPPLLALLLLNKPYIKILDYGGGLGIGYLTLLESIPDVEDKIDYTIIELPKIVNQLKKIIPKIKSLDTIPVTQKFDLIYSASAIQYINDYKELFINLFKNNPEFILLSDVFAGSIPNFVTLQNYYGNKIKSWFLNLDEFVLFFKQNGYKLIMKSYVTSKRNEHEDVLPMNNFPETHKIKYTLHLLFVKIN
jgi:putative methyltransferase (TIGR04325 family)